MALRGKDIDLTIKDKEGNTSLDLLNATVVQTGDLKPFHRHNRHTTRSVSSRQSTRSEHHDDEDDEDLESGDTSIKFEHSTDFADLVGEDVLVDENEVQPGTSFWTWGANNNYTLGHPSQDNRVRPESVTLPAPNLRINSQTFSQHEPQFIQAAMSKYHACAVSQNGVYAWGFGKGGRLGVDASDEKTHLTPQKVHKTLHGKVKCVALGQDHSVCVLEGGDVWTWGSNRFGQLGCGMEQPRQLTPREVGGSLKKLVVIAAAASKFHTAVVTDTGSIYTWGLNVGQLGESCLFSASGVAKRLINHHILFRLPTANLEQLHQFAYITIPEKNHIVPTTKNRTNCRYQYSHRSTNREFRNPRLHRIRMASRILTNIQPRTQRHSILQTPSVTSIFLRF